MKRAAEKSDEEMDSFDEEISEEEEVVVDDTADELQSDHDSAQEQQIPPLESCDEMTFLPGTEIPEGDVLDYDSKAYDMMHAMNVEWPCLSFDIVPDSLGSNRSKFPHTVSLITGSQSSDSSSNKLYKLTVSNLSKTKYDEDSDSESEDENMEIVDPTLESVEVSHPGGVNRIRVSKKQPDLCASWSDLGKVCVWDFSSKPTKPLYTVSSHQQEGWSLDWNPLNNSLLSGDVQGRIVLSECKENGKFMERIVCNHPQHASIEDLQWSPSESSVAASAGTDGVVGIWDLRGKSQKAALSIHAHPGTDVNVISWNSAIQYLLLSGADNGEFSSWDLRATSKSATTTPLSTFAWHRNPITSLEWNPNESSVVAVADDSNQITLWDLSLERDDSDSAHDELEQLPPQLLFIHQGLSHPKEIHWHAQIPGLVIGTGENGFNFFKTANI